MERLASDIFMTQSEIQVHQVLSDAKLINISGDAIEIDPN